VLGVLASPAFAKFSHPFDGQLASASGPFEVVRPNGIAVDDSSGNTYVASPGVVDVFETSSETQLASLDGAATPAGSFGGGELTVAANNATGDVYVLDSADNVVDEFNAAGSFVCQITGAGSASISPSECDTSSSPAENPATPAGGFATPSGIAVDQATGEIYVGDAQNDAVDVFSAAGTYLSQISLASAPELDAPEPHGIAVDDQNGEVYVTNVAPAVVYVFNTAGSLLTTWTGANTPAGSFGEVAILAVAADNTTGDVYVTSPVTAAIDVFDPSGEYLPSQFAHPFASPLAVAVDQASEKVYVADEGVVIISGPSVVVPDVTTNPASAVHPTSATLAGTVNPDAVQLSGCHFDYVPQSQFEASGFESVSAAEMAPCEPAAGSIPPDSSVHTVSAQVTGLPPATSYEVRLQAENANGLSLGNTVIVSTLSPPSIAGEAAVNLTATSADLTARLDPHGLDTTYYFEYGPSAAYGTRTPTLDAGSGTAEVPVSTHLSGLSPNTTYHWRLLATSEAGTTTSVDHSFIYEQAGAALPDNRAYEMVTPPQKNGALIGGVPFSAKPMVADDGSRVILSAVQCFAGAGSCTAVRESTGTLFAFSRTAEGWVTTPLAPPAAQFPTSTKGLSNPNTGSALFSAPTAPGGEDDFYVRSLEGSISRIGPLSPPEGGPNVEAVETVFGSLQSATGDFSRLFFEAEPTWTSFGLSGGQTVLEYAGSSNAIPTLVGVTGAPGSRDLISACRTQLGGSLAGGKSPQGGVSAPGGGIVYFTANFCEAGGTGANAGKPVPVREIYARVSAAKSEAERTVAISEPSAIQAALPNEGCKAEPCKENTSNEADFRGANFVAASRDATKVFFTSSQQLTDEASQDPSESESEPLERAGEIVRNPIACSDPAIGPNGCNLYLYDLPTFEDGSPTPEGRHLIDASACGGCAGGPRVQGVMAVSSDGSHVYFVAQGVLTHTPNDQGQLAAEGAENMYMFELDSSHPQGHVAFIAALPASDLNDWIGSAGEPTNVTPDGRFAVFPSSGALTADVTHTDGAQQIFRYDAQSGHLARISVGARGFADNGNAGVGDASIVFGNRGDLPAGPARTDPTMSDDGSYVFFMSPVGLTAGALNDVRIGVLEGTTKYAENVYEYHEGNVYLISDGHDAAAEPSEVCVTFSAVCLIGTDTTGSNVFFATADQLVAQDTDTQLDFYDARICTTSDPCVKAPSASPPPCLGEACHGTPPATPSLLTPGSVLFSGAGNLPPVAAAKAKPKPLTRAQKLAKALKACRSKRRGKRHACEAQARKRYGPKPKPKQAKKASKPGTRP
jgi:DNA-binding beta-propeller fold protein YncE